MSESNEPQYLCWHSCSSHQLVWFATSLVLCKLLFLAATVEGGWRECRRIKAETDRYGNMPYSIGHVCLPLIHCRRPKASACILKTENTLHLLWRLKENVLQCICYCYRFVSVQAVIWLRFVVISCDNVLNKVNEIWHFNNRARNKQSADQTGCEQFNQISYHFIQKTHQWVVSNNPALHTITVRTFTATGQS